MAFALAQNKPTTGSGANPAPTFTSTPTLGNLLVCTMAAYDSVNGVGALTVPSGWTERARATTSTGGGAIIAEKIAGASESTTASWTDANSLTFWEAECIEFSGVAVSGAEYDKNQLGTYDGLTHTSMAPGSLTPAVVNELVIGVCFCDGANGGTEAITSSFTLLDAATFNNTLHAYKIKTDAAAENPTFSWTTARNTNAALAAFKPALSLPLWRAAARQAVPRAAFY